ncbi:MAG: flagellar basal body rod protein FlgB [Firmicutes bacterium HGW-Firmicutes-7]|nr:MAG: flagellar basal body rod protein FlgB [Firmicutes bacterium HGW-Firmicutes-7]
MHNNTNVLAKALDASWLKSEAISNNIANVDTPGYKRSDVVFESYLQQALDSKGRIKQGSLSRVSPKVIKDNTNLSYRIDGNNVDIDTEMAYMAQNQIKYNTLISQVNYNFNRLKMVLDR